MRISVRLLSVLMALAVALVGSTAHAGSAHFVGDATITRVGDALEVSGKVAGLGNEAQIHVSVTALAECINPGSNKPKAANKESVSAEGDFPVQNGKANYALTLVAIDDLAELLASDGHPVEQRPDRGRHPRHLTVLPRSVLRSLPAAGGRSGRPRTGPTHPVSYQCTPRKSRASMICSDSRPPAPSSPLAAAESGKTW